MSKHLLLRHSFPWLLLTPALCQATVIVGAQPSPKADDPWTLDFRYAPPVWQTSICLPDDWQKTLVGKDGALLYDYPGQFSGFGTKITPGLAERTDWVEQRLAGPRLPVVITKLRSGNVEVLEEAFAVTEPLGSQTKRRAALTIERVGSQTTQASWANPPARTDPGGSDNSQPDRAPRRDLVILHLRNTSSTATTVNPTVLVESQAKPMIQPDGKHVRMGAATTLSCPESVQFVQESESKLRLRFPEQALPPGAERQLTFIVTRGQDTSEWLKSAAQAQELRRAAEHFWAKADLPYDHLQVPDKEVQALVDSSIRNIYQAREIKKGLPAFQVGPTCYRGLWVVDGSFLLEAITYLGRTSETRDGVKYLLSFQRDDGGIMLIDGHWKETGIALWAVTRHARLTGDQAWLREVWPKVERGVAYIQVMRQMASTNQIAPNYELIPDGFSDGGLADKVPEYTNIYWTLAGLHAAVEAARWLGNSAQADLWQRQYDDFMAAFRRAAERDSRVDSQGRPYLPIRMARGEDIPPQKAQWAFLHSVFPGQVYSPGDPLVQGNMAMLHAVEKEGLVLDTGWLKDGIWNYFGSFYGHAWLWLGDGDKAARTLYAFGNHASPVLVWREEHKPQGQGNQFVGDMPHNWASAEFIRLVRHSLLLERGNELHLFEGLSAKWVAPGAVTRVNDVMTEFGSASLELRVTKDGSEALLDLQPPKRTAPSRIVLHLDNWSGQTGTLDLPVNKPVHQGIRLR
jgi:hypothetical protein